MALEERLRGPYRALIASALGAIAMNSCSPDPESSANRPPSVLFIAIDTLRADKLGCYGGTRGLTPNIDRLASEGARFEHAFSHAPWTLPAFASLFTSLLPPEHGAGGSLTDAFRALPDSADTIAEQFDAAGYATAAVVNVDFLSKTFGLMQGFRDVDGKFFDNNREMRNASDTTRDALRWLDDRSEKPFFLFVHYFDAHAEYSPPQPFRRRFAKPQDTESDGFTFGTREQIVAYRRGEIQFRPLDIDRAEALYDGEVAYTDAEVGVLLAGLRERGLDSSTLVVLTADHGEEFLDHGGYEHGHALYDELIAVPLIVRQPSKIPPGTITLPVGHVDVAPTLCALTGVEPSSRFRGRDLSPLLRGAALPPSPLVAYGNFWGNPLSSLRIGEFKLIRNPPRERDSDRLELYQWTQDAHEKNDLAAAEMVRTRELELELDRELELATQGRGGSAPSAPVSPEELERLRGLGYIQSGQPASPPK